MFDKIEDGAHVERRNELFGLDMSGGARDSKIPVKLWGEIDENKTVVGRKEKGKVLLVHSFDDVCPETVNDAQSSTAYCTESERNAVEEVNSDSDSEITVGDEVPTENAIIRCKMISVISRTDGYFKSQQRGEADLTRAEKKAIASSLLDTKPSNFLSRYGKYLRPEHLKYFQQFQGQYEIDVALQQLQKVSSPKVKNVLVKNRRYQALKEMINKGEYFSMKEMKNRNPHLFQHLVGRYMSEEERKNMEPEDQLCNLSTVLMAHMDRDQHSSQRRKQQEAELIEWEGEPSSEEEEEEEEDLLEEEKVMLKEEFVSSSYRNFIEGKDKEFDYATVDENSQYDNIQLQERDEEDRYFDTDMESPEPTEEPEDTPSN